MDAILQGKMPITQQRQLADGHMLVSSHEEPSTAAANDSAPNSQSGTTETSQPKALANQERAVVQAKANSAPLEAFGGVPPQPGSQPPGLAPKGQSSGGLPSRSGAGYVPPHARGSVPRGASQSTSTYRHSLEYLSGSLPRIVQGRRW